MTVTATVLFGSLRSELASVLKNKLTTSVRTEIVVGFATKDGMKAIQGPIASHPATLVTFVIGAGTYGAFDAFDYLLGKGVQADALRVHLGHTRANGPSARNPFQRYHPMLHSKIYYMEHADGTASALIGSHNVTKFALLGLNGEASVLLQGEKSSPEFEKVRTHIAQAKREAIAYSTAMKAELAQWAYQSLDGLASAANSEFPRDVGSNKTILILCEHAGTLPAIDQVLYFELHEDLGLLRSLSAEIHLYVFDRLSATPQVTLAMLASARVSYECEAVGLDVAQGGTEFRTDWILDENAWRILPPTSAIHRPRTRPGMQQVRVRFKRNIPKRYEYLFDAPGKEWVPEIDSGSVITVPSNLDENPEKQKSSSRDGDSWFLVKNLVRKQSLIENKQFIAMRKMSPEEGSFLLMSLRRRDLGQSSKAGKSQK